MVVTQADYAPAVDALLGLPPELTLEAARQQRNQSWEGCQHIPGWVDTATVDLDCFYTQPAVAATCLSQLIAVMRGDNAPVDRYHFVDPGAGQGAFYQLLPAKRRTGLDVYPQYPGIIESEYLTWSPSGAVQPYAVIGNPPFGYRAWLALAFLNHSATFADYVGFVLPMSFQSDGKGSPKYRVHGAQLVHSEQLPPDAFVDLAGDPVKLNTLWQIWRRGSNVTRPAQACDQWLDLFTVDTREERRCGHKRLTEADWFLQRTFFGAPPTLVRDFADVRYGCGYGIVLKQAEAELTAALRQTDWRRYSNLAVHNCRHISMYHIRQALIDQGYADE